MVAAETKSRGRGGDGELAEATSEEIRAEDANHSHLCTGTIFSAAAHAVVASLMCQTVLSHFLANANGANRLSSSVWYGNSDAVLSKEVSAPNRKCVSERCRRQQKARRKNLHKMKMRKVLKVSNMFSWTKKKNTAGIFGGGGSAATAKPAESAEKAQEEEDAPALTMTELAARASARRAARRKG